MTAMVDTAISQLGPVVGVRQACAAVGVAQADWYRRHRQTPAPPRPTRPRRAQPRALTPVERAEVREVLNSPEHVDEAPATVYAKLLDEGRYLASERTMYRILAEHGEVKERRRQATHPAAVKPELVADAPNRVWSWDITRLGGAAKWSWFYLYVIIDIFSRYVPGWMLATAENHTNAKALLADTIDKQNIPAGQLYIHSDRGSPMIAKPVAFMLAELGSPRPQPTALLERQPVQRSALPDVEVSARVPRPVRVVHPRCPALRDVLRLVQPRASPLRHRAPHPVRCPPRPRPSRP